MNRNAHELAREIQALTPQAKLKLSAELIERGKLDLAYSIARGVVTEIGAALAMQIAKGKP